MRMPAVRVPDHPTPISPWALGFARHRAARNFLFGLTAVTAVVAALTDWSGPGAR